MSKNKEIAINIINQMPEQNMAYIVNILKGLKNLPVIEEVEPDEWDLEMIARANHGNDGTYVSLDDLLKKDGLTYEDLQV